MLVPLRESICFYGERRTIQKFKGFSLENMFCLYGQLTLKSAFTANATLLIMPCTLTAALCDSRRGYLLLTFQTWSKAGNLPSHWSFKSTQLCIFLIILLNIFQNICDISIRAKHDPVPKIFRILYKRGTTHCDSAADA